MEGEGGRDRLAVLGRGKGLGGKGGIEWVGWGREGGGESRKVVG